MYGEGHASRTCSEVQIFEIHSEADRVNVHAWIERNLTKVSTEQQAVFVLSSIDTNHVGVSIEIGIGQATKD